MSHAPTAETIAAPETDLRARWRRHRGPVLVLWLVALAVVASFMVSSRTVSPIDEAAHLDYVLRMPQQFPAAGEQMLDETLEIWSCRGTELDMALPGCRVAPGEPGLYPGAAYGLAGSHPPAYYAVTDVLGNVLHALTPLDVLDSYRAVGVLWLGLALTATYALGIAVGAARSASLGLTLMVASTATVAWQSGSLGNDTASWFTGTLFLLAAVTYRRRLPWVVALLAGSVLVALTKQTGFLAVGAAAIVLVLRAPTSPGWWRDWLMAVGAVLAFTVPSLGWTAYSSAQAVGDQSLIPQNQEFAVAGGWPWAAIAQQAIAFLTPISDPPPGSYLSSEVMVTFVALPAGVMMLGVAAGVLAVRERPRLAALAIGTAVLLLVGGPLLATANYAMTQTFFDLNRRYGFALLGAMVACGAAVVEARPVRRALLVGGVVMVVLALAQSAVLGLARG